MVAEKQNFVQRITRRLLSVPLRLKISVPYLIIATLLAALATFQVSRAFQTTLEGRLRGQLADAAARVAEGVIAIEARQLTWLRTLAFTAGVPESLAEEDYDTLKNLVFPQIVNNNIPFVEILDRRGNPVATWHTLGQPGFYEENENTDYTSWPLVRDVLAGENDELGNKYAEIVATPWGLVLYTAGPIITTENELLGVILVGTPMEEVVLELKDQSIADVTIYDPQGRPTVSSLGIDASSTALSPQQQEQISANPEVVPLRNIASGQRGYIEALELLYIRAEPTGWYFGVSLPEALIADIQGPSIWQLVLIFALGVLILIGLGVLVAQTIAIPISNLVQATRKVGEGELEVEVNVFADDEIGYLTQGFNQMVADLKQREFIAEIFGRMVSEEVREAVLQGQIALGGEIRAVAVLFTDIRGFTSLAERIPATEMISVLNEFFSVISRATKKHQGLINRFGGDSALVVFGAPIKRPLFESLEHAIEAAIDIRVGIAVLNAERISRSLQPLRFGIGINSGNAVAGNLGSEDRFEYTVIGDVVNVAARLQGLTRDYPQTPLLIPASSVKPVREQLAVEFLDLGEFQLKGKEKPTRTYAILGPRLSETALFDSLDIPAFNALLACYLYCLGFSVQVASKTLQIEPEIIRRCLQIGHEKSEHITELLTQHFDLKDEQIERLRSYAEKDQLETT